MGVSVGGWGLCQGGVSVGVEVVSGWCECGGGRDVGGWGWA